MDKEKQKLEKVREFLSSCPTEFVLIFRGQVTRAGLELRWCAAVSRDKKSRGEYDQLAAAYEEIARHSFQKKQSIVLKETPSRPSAQSVRWCGLDIYTAPYNGPLPTNSIGQSWWHLVVEPRDNRTMGHVIIARLAAKDDKEVEALIRKVYQMMDD